ncbi:Gnk2-homologous domain-containing protein [Cynara cardunculus var. scolymus]|uniref:Gnk2-homologous domain-containing protein n=1 Tax=Cynara cardunculus var. scolymus TaxID=59895 RepID=A0A103XSS5_CYNCS|nr:Gnk2-homologous domain-containing protein [Cynara cardunculus var. scolymus]
MLQQTLWLSCFIFLLFSHLSSSATDSFIYGGCSQPRFTPGSPYESNVDSILTSLVNSASFSSFNNFKISVPGSTQSDIVYGLFQCRGDLSTSDCRDCVAHSVSRLGIICPDATGGAMQLDGCFVKYDSAPFLGVEDKTEVFKKCGPSIGYNSDVLTRRDAVLAYMTSGNGQYFRVGGSGSVQGVAQCIQDLSLSECQDCVAEAGGRLKSECGASAWGDMYLGKCYVRYSERGFHSRSDDDNGDVDKTLAIIIGIIAGVAMASKRLRSMNIIFPLSRTLLKLWYHQDQVALCFPSFFYEVLSWWTM